MKRLFLMVLLAILVFSFAVKAQDDFSSTRLDTAAAQLKRNSVDLVDRTSENMRRSASNTKNDIEEAFLAHQLDGAAGLFQLMVSNKRRASELREAAEILTELVRRAPGSGVNSDLWRNAQTAINDIKRELGNSGGGGGGGGNTDNRPIIGRVFWRGMVDDKIQLVIRERQIETRTISGQSNLDGTFSFTAALPTREVTVGVNKTKGRGTVRVIQQPLASNDYTTIVEIYDDGGGAKEYQMEIFWR